MNFAPSFIFHHVFVALKFFAFPLARTPNSLNVSPITFSNLFAVSPLSISISLPPLGPARRRASHAQAGPRPRPAQSRQRPAAPRGTRRAAGAGSRSTRRRPRATAARRRTQPQQQSAVGAGGELGRRQRAAVCAGRRELVTLRAHCRFGREERQQHEKE